MAVVEESLAHDDHHHEEHGEFIAHHFDSAEQQFDAGKLGIWVFLVTEILFFSGLFVAYTLYRVHHPEIFDQAHVFLDKYLGFANTVVLLFSSLTMALAVRSAQLGHNRQVTFYTLITMICASFFIGVKAIEYSHKWDMKILVRSAFDYSPGHHAAAEGTLAHMLGVSEYLIYLSVVPALVLVGFVAWWIIAMLTAKPNVSKWALMMAIATGGYFLGAFVGQIYMNATEGGVGGHANQTVVLYAQEGDHQDHDGDEHGDNHKAGADDEHHDGDSHDAGHSEEVTDFDRDIGIFFSIYYCMTGLHAIHIIGGFAFLGWILWRSILGHWRTDYFGPVDYVGLYWHLVDLIWIYLFPLLYLID